MEQTWTSAGDEIARLRKLNDELVAALELITDTGDGLDARRIARAALAKVQP